MKLEYQLMDIYREEMKRALRNSDRRYHADKRIFRKIRHEIDLIKIEVRFGMLGYRWFGMKTFKDFRLMGKIFSECYNTRWEKQEP